MCSQKVLCFSLVLSTFWLLPYSRYHRLCMPNLTNHLDQPNLQHRYSTEEIGMETFARVGIKFAETRLSVLICQTGCQALEFKGYGKNFIFWVMLSAINSEFVELNALTAMTKLFLHGSIEAIWTVQPQSVNFTMLSSSSCMISGIR